MTDYEAQADKFLSDTKTELSVTKIGCLLPSWAGENDEPVNAYSVILSNERHIYEFKFYSSLRDTYGPYDSRYDSRWGTPEHKARLKWRKEMRNKNYKYDVLACLNVDYSEDYEDFAGNYGYEVDSIKGRDVYLAVRKETKNLKMLFTETQLEQLHEVS